MLVDNQNRLRDVLTELNALKAKQSLSDTEDQRFTVLLEEGAALQTHIERDKKAADLEEWASKSAGGLRMAGTIPGPKIEALRPDGQVSLEHGSADEAIKAGKLSESDRKQWEHVRTHGYKSALESYLRAKGSLDDMDRAAVKVLQEGADVSGGYLVPEDIIARLIAKEPTPTNVNGRVTRLTTSRDRIVIPKVNYASAIDDASGNLYPTPMRMNWTGEIPASSTTHRVTQPVFGQAAVPIYTAMLSLPLTNDMVEDASYPIVSWVTNQFGILVDLGYDYYTIAGSGIGQPEGITVNGDVSTVVSGATAALTGDGLINLAFALPPQYDQNAAFVCSKLSAALGISKLKDGNGRYLWGAGLQDSGIVPNIKGRQLLGYDMLWNEFMPTVSVGNKAIIFGDLTGYYLINRIGFSVQVLRELYAETNQILLLGRLRFGGKVIEDWKLKTQTVSA